MSIVNWSEFPPELLEIIASKLKIYIDYVRFRAVCVKWRSVVSPKPHHLPTQLPWLVFPFGSDIETDRYFLDLSTNKFHQLNLDESRDSSRCCGSSQGWLVFVEKFTPAIRLINSLTRNVIHLPPLTTFPNVLDYDISKSGEEYLIQTLNGEQYRSNMKNMRDLFIKKVVLSSSPNSLENDYIALAILNVSGDLAFHKKGVEEWSIIEEAQSCYEDAIYYNGFFYAINEVGTIAICDLSGVSPIVTLDTITAPPLLGHDVYYLVDSLGELMLVIRSIQLIERQFDSGYDNDDDCVLYDDDDDCAIYETYDFSVFKYDSSKPEWVQMETLGDHILFLGGNSSLCLSAFDFSGCKRNCIYFSSDKNLVNGNHDFGVCDLDDSSIGPLPYGDGSSRHMLPPPIWVTPNPC